MRVTPRISRQTRPLSQCQRAKFCRPSVEALESRIPLAADLEAFDAYLVDINANPIEGVVEGERVLVRVNYRMTDLTTDDKFRIRFELGR